MPSASAVELAFSRDREASAMTSPSTERCIAGMTFVRAILAAPSTPHRIFFMPPPALSPAGIIRCGGRPHARPQRAPGAPDPYGADEDLRLRPVARQPGPSLPGPAAVSRDLPADLTDRPAVPAAGQPRLRGHGPRDLSRPRAAGNRAG